jgi:hypothetical protein
VMNWKEYGRKQSCPNCKNKTRHSSGRTEENHENLNQISRSPGPIIDRGTSRIRSGSVNHSTTMFGNSETRGGYSMHGGGGKYIQIPQERDCSETKRRLNWASKTGREAVDRIYLTQDKL